MVKAIDKSGKVRIFASSAEAAKALGLDSSNISKVLRGKRQTVGGWHFEKTTERPTTKAGRTKVRERKQSAARKRLLNTVHDRLKEINVRYRNAKKENLLASDPVLQKMMNYADYFGATKTGGYDISAKNLRQYSDEELTNLLSLLSKEEGKYSKYYDKGVSEQGDPLSYVATIFGLSSRKEAEKYADIIPEIFDLLHLAKIDEFFRYNDVKTALFNAMQEGADDEEIDEYLAEIQRLFFESRSEGALQSKSSELDTLLSNLQKYGEDDEYSDRKKYQ